MSAPSSTGASGLAAVNFLAMLTGMGVKLTPEQEEQLRAAQGKSAETTTNAATTQNAQQEEAPQRDLAGKTAQEGGAEESGVEETARAKNVEVEGKERSAAAAAMSLGVEGEKEAGVAARERGPSARVATPTRREVEKHRDTTTPGASRPELRTASAPPKAARRSLVVSPRPGAESRRFHGVLHWKILPR